jgi:NitT/TauT family transport system substrate-binding protein
MRRTRRLVAVCASILLMASISSMLLWPARSQAAPVDHVKVRADVFFYGAHIPIIVGIVDGIYAKYNIDATFLAGRGSATTIQTVANQSDQFGYADGAALTRLTAKGLHAKQIMGMLQTTSVAVMTFPDSGLKVPKDLDGKTTGFAPGSATDQIFPAFAKKAGVDMASIKGLSVDPTTRDNLFLLKKIDFDIALAVAQLPILEEKCKCRLNLMRFSNYGINLMSNGIVASDELIAKDPDLVKRFVAATLEATRIAMSNPQHGVDDFMTFARNSGVSRSVVTEQWAQAIKVMHTKRTADKGVGVMDPQDWQDTIDILTQYAGLPANSVKPEMVFTNAFLPK